MSLYQSIKMNWKKPEFILMYLFIAVNILLSFGQTKEVAEFVGAETPIHKAAFSIILEGLFAFTLLTRADQRAQGLHVPLFLNVAYYGLLGSITAINISVLYRHHPIFGPPLGLLIACTMLYVEKLFVWKSTEADKPAQKKLKDMLKEAKQEIKEEQVMQEIEYLKYEARRPSLKLIKRARKDQRKRKRIEQGKSILSVILPWRKNEEQGLPEYFLQKKDPIKEIVAELHETQPKTVDVQDQKEAKELVPFRRQIGFHMERTDEKPKSPAPLFQPNMEARKEAIETAKRLQKELGRLPKQRELIESGISEYYAKWARKELKNQ
jgi:hypothetical protein